MLRALMVSRLAAAFVMAVASVVFAGGSAAMAQTPGQDRPGAAPPGTHGVPGTPPVLRPEQIEKRISPEEREKLGLPEPTWVAQHGKVHPDVRPVLETGQMPWLRFKGWAPIGFEGTAYVAVYLRYDQRGKAASPENEAAIKELQTRLLSRLTAPEFSVVHLFRNIPGILGYVDSDGVAKLAQDADVIAVGLDDKPVPQDPPRATHEPRPPPKRGERPPPIERIGKVEAQVYKALENSADAYVFVIVSVKSVPLDPGAFDQAYQAHQAEKRKLQDRVLSSLTGEEFRVRTRGALLAGYVDRPGLEKLASHPDVERVGLRHGPIEFPGTVKKDKR